MSQNKESGAIANTFGRETAKLISKAIGAVSLGSRSNEASYNGARVVIKSARSTTNCVGITYKMLKRLDFVLGAFQEPNGKFLLYSLPANIFCDNMRETRSRGPSSGKVGIVSRSVFENNGKELQCISVLAT